MSKSQLPSGKYIAPFRVDGGKKFRLRDYKTNEDGGLDKAAGNKIIASNRTLLSDLQEKLYAQDSWSLLLIFQGMDAAGKDSAIKSVFDGINPQGCHVKSFKQPSTNELNHDFMWRSTIALPSRGQIGIFNRSYYEECLVVRVHPEILAKQKIPKQLVGGQIWRERFEDIRAFERYLARNGTVVLKFFLNVSKEEQRQRFLDRLEEPAKNWKFSMADVTERKVWDKYQNVYEEMIDGTSSEDAPWHVVPADRKWFARVVIGSVIVNALRKLDLKFPVVEDSALSEFKRVREALEREGEDDKDKGDKSDAVNKVKDKSDIGEAADIVAKKPAATSATGKSATVSAAKGKSANANPVPAKSAGVKSGTAKPAPTKSVPAKPVSVKPRAKPARPGGHEPRAVPVASDGVESDPELLAAREQPDEAALVGEGAPVDPDQR